jgi:hypothetical protein
MINKKNRQQNTHALCNVNGFDSIKTSLSYLFHSNLKGNTMKPMRHSSRYLRTVKFLIIILLLLLLL